MRVVRSGFHHDPECIDADGGEEFGLLPQPDSREQSDSFELRTGHGLERGSKCQVPTSLHLDEDDGFTISGNDVDLALLTPEVAFYDHHSLPLQESGCKILTCLPQGALAQPSSRAASTSRCQSHAEQTITGTV